MNEQKHMMDDLDKMFEEMLKETGIGSFGDQGVFAMMVGVFRGRDKWLTVMVGVFSFVLFGVFIYAVVQFFQAQTVQEWIGYLGLFMWSAMAVGMLKMWMWMVMNRNAVIREVKRLELRIVSMHESEKTQD